MDHKDKRQQNELKHKVSQRSKLRVKILKVNVQIKTSKIQNKYNKK